MILTQKQNDFVAPRAARLVQSLNATTAAIRQANKDRAFDEMLATLQACEPSPRVTRAIYLAKLATK